MENQIKKVLVVEDDNDLRNILVDGLSVSNYQVFQAGDGEQAVALLVDQNPIWFCWTCFCPSWMVLRFWKESANIRTRQYPN